MPADQADIKDCASVESWVGCHLYAKATFLIGGGPRKEERF